jgi:hypothetical protein
MHRDPALELQQHLLLLDEHFLGLANAMLVLRNRVAQSPDLFIKVNAVGQ